ncbi:hypothetical protein PRIPAC_80369 [Pristionchus pacificus]|nr:hypothetical protein PRIPAC_80369 [Pristionchus pacificus]|eukprot:PDM78512.1 hypothetical protein PRIPAC_31091 [Pristionchus pacificus]
MHPDILTNTLEFHRKDKSIFIIIDFHSQVHYNLSVQNLLAERIFQRTDRGGEKIIHLTTIHLGSEYAGRLEMVIKSIFLFHGGIIHFHVISDASAMETLSMMFQTWRIKRLRWSLYVLDRTHERVDFIPTPHRAGNIGFIRLFVHDILPLYVILLDNDVILLDDIAVMHGIFKEMEKQGAFFGASPNMYSRRGIRAKLPNKDGGPNVGVVMLDLKRMRETNWDDLWMNETLWNVHEFGPPTASEQDIFTSLEYHHPSWGFRLPCEYNYQLEENTDISFCPTGLRNDGVKLPHWTGRQKWSLNDKRAKYFTRIYQCIEMIDWEEINGVDADLNMAPARTLLYMKEGEKPKPRAVTLSSSVKFNESFAVIDRVKEWPGAVDLIVIGTDRERMQMRDFISKNEKTIGARISIHFVHKRSNLSVELFDIYIHKLGADISRTAQVLLTFDLNLMKIDERK